MKSLAILILVSFISLLSYGQKEMPNAEVLDVTPVEMDSIIDIINRYPDKTQLSIALMADGQIQYLGFKKVDGRVEHLDNRNHVFEIGSISKVFTGTLLSTFAVDGTLSIDDNIEDYLDYTIAGDKDITFKSLSNHTSGLPRLPSNLGKPFVNPNNPYAGYNGDKLKEFMASIVEVNQESIDRFSYSNLGAGLLGYILGEISGTSYEEMLQDRIFSKYNMTQSTTQRESVKDKLVHGLNYNGDETPNWDFDALAGAGAILSSVEDLSKFLKAQLVTSDPVIELTHQRTHTINAKMKIGLGWHMITQESGQELLWHNGATGGYVSSMGIDKQTGSGVIILSNVSAYNPEMKNIDQLCFGLIAMLDK